MSTLRQSLMPRGNEKNVHTSLLKPQSCTQLSFTWTIRYGAWFSVMTMAWLSSAVRARISVRSSSTALVAGGSGRLSIKRRRFAIVF